MDAWIGIGSNMGDSVAHLGSALKLLGDVPFVQLRAASSLYRTLPWGDTEQPDFINAAAWVETELGPEELFGALKAIEKAMGRTLNSERWGPRLIDLDLLLMVENGEPLMVSQPHLQVPHPHLHERSFVLVPLAELDPALAIPGQGTVQHCLDRVGAEGVTALEATVN